MDFVIQWLWYLLAFVAGSAVARVIANIMNKRVDVDEVPSASTARGIGGER
ncbi:channel accessory protein ArfB [Mycobacterium interjectum]|uniref:channel accessory protein ArfB n=1 Tax=Mycobacterium interjectum TaxID=33895 RepID=UPI000AE72597|nr:hypothetical protein [Mycobacterium interjectum]MCV7092165.1 hypothetical protein [Mycobacterium interjectum]